MDATTMRRHRALLLDDDPAVLRRLGTALEARGFEIRAALDGAAGVALLIDELLDLDVVVADVDLPGRDAWALLDLVRRAGGERDLGIVVLAADASAVRPALLAMGADAVVGLDVDAAAQAVDGAVARRLRGAQAAGATVPPPSRAHAAARTALAPPLLALPA